MIYITFFQPMAEQNQLDDPKDGLVRKIKFNIVTSIGGSEFSS